jgi:hypothetical protein
MIYYLVLCAAAIIADVALVGRLTFAEMLLVAALPLLAFGSRRPTPLVQQFYIFSALWFLGAVVTDLVRQTPIDDVFRGWSKILFFMLNFTSIRLLVDGKRQRTLIFIFALLVAGVIRLRVQPDTSELGADIFGSGWKFGYGQLVAGASFLVAAAMLSNPMTRMFGMALPFVDALLNLALLARNLFGLTALSALIFAMTFGRRRRNSPVYLMTIIAAVVALGWGSLSIYAYAAKSGFLGLDAQNKYELQTSGTLGLLLGGRGESLASTQAIIDSPILGHGSWARDVTYVELLVTRMEEAGYEIQGDPFSEDLIPSHSHLLGAWVEAGILGAVFWTWAAWVAARGIYAVVTRPTPLSGFIIFIGLSLLWDIFFSPFGLERRVITPAWILLMILVTEDSERRTKTG